MTQCLASLRYGSFSERLHGAGSGGRIPLDGSLELTERCNLRCRHCYINRPLGDRAAASRELTTAEMHRLIDEIAGEGCLWLLLTGGEPLVRPDFLEIYDHAKRRGMLVSLFTNGTLVTPEVAEHLEQWAPFSVEITLYGRTEETYEKVTGVPGSYRQCLRGIELLIAHKVPLRLKTILLTVNRHELGEMESFAGALGVEFRFDPILNFRLDGSPAPSSCRLSPEEAVSVDMGEPRRWREWQELDRLMRVGRRDDERLFACGAGIGSFHVDSYGGLSPCLMARHVSCDLRSTSFREAWEDWMPDVRAQKWTTEATCRRCSLMHLCGRCPGHAYLETGSPEQVVPYLCRVGHLRELALRARSEGA
jgi:radical SAM protein with 4Fe4S-binding SPASM domain